MTALFFISLIIILFVSLLVYETSRDTEKTSLRNYGLFTWLISGNWPAKVGAILLIFGVGALIRYGFIHIQLPPVIKLWIGIIAATLLGVAAFFAKFEPKRRAIYLSLAGAALGTAYLTAYSAYGFFGYINDTTGLALLVMVAVSGGIFAAGANAPSIAVLAMVGAYIAPAFSIGEPKPINVLGYYLAASALSFLLVWEKGWRPLIHLSFLFTLAGSLFFGWTQEFYRPGYYSQVIPLLYALVIIHLIMPLAERRAQRGAWVKRFDLVYAILLPAVAATLMWAIAPDLRKEGAFGIAGLAVIWGIASLILYSLKETGSSLYASISTILITIAALLFIPGIPWSVVGLVLSAVILSISARFGAPTVYVSILTGAALLFAIGHISGSLLANTTSTAFLNHLFAERLISVLAIAWAGFISRRENIGLGYILIAVSVTWAGITLVAEFYRLQYEFLAETVHIVLIAVALVVSAFRAARTLPKLITSLLSISIALTAWWASRDTSLNLVAVLCLLDVIVLALLGRGGSKRHDEYEWPGILSVMLIPFVFLIWGTRINFLLEVNSLMLILTALSIGLLISVLLAKIFEWKDTFWSNGVVPFVYWFLCAALGIVVLFYIERSFWGVSFELITLSVLYGFLTIYPSGAHDKVKGLFFVILLVLFIQSMSLRLLGPDGEILSVFDLQRMNFPAVISLIWSLLGAILCWWGTRISSRNLWTFGAFLLVVSAMKFILLDFPSLDQLGNIIALIVSGLVFMGVAWLAPLPPKSAPADDRTDESGHKQSSFQHAVNERNDNAAARQSKIWSHTEDARATKKSPDTQPIYTVLIAAVLVLTGGVGFFIYQSVINLKQLERSTAQRMLEHSDSNNISGDHQEKNNPIEMIAETESPITIERKSVVNQCTQFREIVPDNYVLYAAGAYGGKESFIQIDKSDGNATLFDIYIDEPDRPVVVALGAYKSSVWVIHKSPQTRLAGVFLSGYYQQRIIGLDRSVPILTTNRHSKGECGYFFVTREGLTKAEIILEYTFGKIPESYFIANDGLVTIGLRDYAVARTAIDAPQILQLHLKNTPYTGDIGISQLIRERKLRLATRSDIQNLPKDKISTNLSLNMKRTFVVQAPMQYPAGLHGAHLAVFIIPKGMKRPEGDPGHSFIIDLN